MAEVEYRQARTVATRIRLMRAMEKLCAQHGVENVTVRAVVEEAGQKNESALQYHFKNRKGLIGAIHRSRFVQTQEKRRELLTQCLANNSAPSVRDLCNLMVAPTFQLCRTDAGYRQWIKAFGAINASVRHPMMEEEVIVAQIILDLMIKREGCSCCFSLIASSGIIILYLLRIVRNIQYDCIEYDGV